MRCIWLCHYYQGIKRISIPKQVHKTAQYKEHSVPAHTKAQRRTYTHTHAHLHTQAHTGAHAHTYPFTHTYIYPITHTYIYVCIYTHRRTHIPTIDSRATLLLLSFHTNHMSAHLCGVIPPPPPPPHTHHAHNIHTHPGSPGGTVWCLLCPTHQT